MPLPAPSAIETPLPSVSPKSEADLPSQTIPPVKDLAREAPVSKAPKDTKAARLPDVLVSSPEVLTSLSPSPPPSVPSEALERGGVGNEDLKAVLMDQQKIAGVGNIYANDALLWAGIFPTRSAKTLSDEEISKLKSAIEKVINLGLKYGGSSENTYVNIEGQKGHYMEITAVYQKKKDPKGHEIKKIKIGGRGSFYCPICQ